MGKDIEIKYMTVQIPKTIKVNGKSYPIHPRNIEIVTQYHLTGDESVLDNLVDFSIQF